MHGEDLKINFTKNFKTPCKWDSRQTIQLYKILLKQNYFSYDGKSYNQTEGLKMGSPSYTLIFFWGVGESIYSIAKLIPLQAF